MSRRRRWRRQVGRRLLHRCAPMLRLLRNACKGIHENPSDSCTTQPGSSRCGCGVAGVIRHLVQSRRAKQRPSHRGCQLAPEPTCQPAVQPGDGLVQALLHERVGARGDAERRVQEAAVAGQPCSACRGGRAPPVAKSSIECQQLRGQCPRENLGFREPPQPTLTNLHPLPPRTHLWLRAPHSAGPGIGEPSPHAG